MEKKMTNKLSMILLSLVSLAGFVGKAEARATYMLAGKLPSCGVCHWVTPQNGLEITRRYDSETGKLTYVGPYTAWEGGNVFSKADSYCKAKLQDEGATMQWWVGKCAAGAPINAVSSLQASPKIGTVVESDSIGDLGNADAATDIWLVTCPVDAAQLTVAVRDNAPRNPALISIQIKKGDAASSLSIDKSETNQSYSKEVSLAAGGGSYEVLVNKSDSTQIGIESYSAKFSCKLETRKITNIDSIENTQNQ